MLEWNGGWTLAILQHGDQFHLGIELYAGPMIRFLAGIHWFWWTLELRYDKG